MRVPVEKIQDKMLISIPNALEHPSIAQYGLDRLKLHALRRAGKLRAISIVSKKRPKQQFYRTTLEWVREAIETHVLENTPRRKK